jgi:hypothetical protein
MLHVMLCAGVFTVACFVSPVIVGALGNKKSLFVGTLGYAGLIAFSWLYFMEYVPSSMVVFGGAWCGFSASLLWTAQGRLDWIHGRSLINLFHVLNMSCMRM